MTKTPSRRFHYTQSILLGALAGISLAIAFSAGFLIRDMLDIAILPSAQAADPMGEAQIGYPLVDEVQTLIDDHYLRDQPSYTERQYAAVRGVLGILGDRNTFFIEPPVAQSESDVLAGTYGGVGLLLQRAETGMFVLYPFADGPAAAAGIEDGDILVAINGTIIELSSQPDVVDQMLRGEVIDGNGVEITVITNNGAGQERTVFVEFAVINIPSVVWRVLNEDSRIGYIQILRFTNRTPDELGTALTELRGNGIEAIVLDLRNNSGGLLQESITVASQFLEAGTVVIYERNNRTENTYVAEGGGLATDWPMVVLVNHGTASASELVAGAIVDHGRGILVGQTTFGKGTVQQIYGLSDGSSVHITSAEWLTPNRNAIDGTGLEPTIPMIPDENGRDVELGEAIRYLQGILEEE